jgi:hypothetical protein
MIFPYLKHPLFFIIKKIVNKDQITPLTILAYKFDRIYLEVRAYPRSTGASYLLFGIVPHKKIELGLHF